MPQATSSAGVKVKGFVWLLLFTLVLWLALSPERSGPELVCGLLVCLIVSLLGAHAYSRLGFPAPGIKMVLFSIVYMVILLWEIVKANLDVAYRVIHPKMPIKPGIVAIRTSLKSDVAKMILANSITLTPGTFTLDVIGDKLLVHWINVRSADVDEATKMIGQRFERYLGMIFA